MATAQSRARLISQLSRKGRSSPSEDEYTTASSFESFDAAKDAIHSTVQLDATEQSLPAAHSISRSKLETRTNKLRNYYQDNSYNQDYMSAAGSEASVTEQSIELGRGLPKSERGLDPEFSQQVVYNAGKHQNKIAPATRFLTTPRTGTEVLRRQSALRRIGEAEVAKLTAKTNNTNPVAPVKNPKQRSLSSQVKHDVIEDIGSFVIEDTTMHSATSNTRNTRFTRSRDTSLNKSAFAAIQADSPAVQMPSHMAVANNTTTQTNSWNLPELPNIKELVSGTRKDGTPVFNRAAKVQSRFTSGSFQYQHHEHELAEELPVPDEEKAIYASIQLLKDRVDELEMDKSESQKRAEEYENEIIELRSQLTVIQRRPDSALGSDEDFDGHAKMKKEKQKLQASVQSLQERFNRSERQVSVSEMAVKRVTKERDELVTQIGVAYYNNEELKSENEAFRESHIGLQTEVKELKDIIDALKKENQDMRQMMAETQESYELEMFQRQQKWTDLKHRVEKRTEPKYDGGDSTVDFSEARSLNVGLKSRKEGMDRPLPIKRAERPKSEGSMKDDLASLIEKEIEKNRNASGKSQASAASRLGSRSIQDSTFSRVDLKDLKSAARAEAKRMASKVSTSGYSTTEPTDIHLSDAESTTQLDFSQPESVIHKETAKSTTKKGRSEGPPHKIKTLFDNDKDVTLLSWQDPEEVVHLRMKLEDDLFDEKSAKEQSMVEQAEDTLQSAKSLKKFHRDLLSGELREQCAADVRKQQLTEPQAVPTLPRKSSMKDASGKIGNGTGLPSLTGENLAKVVKSVRVQSPHTSDGSINPRQQYETNDASSMSNTSRRRRRADSADAVTSAFIVPDITISSFHSISQQSGCSGACGLPLHKSENCTICRADKETFDTPTPIAVSEREDPDLTDATIRPAEPPPIALATVIKQLEDEVKHLKIKLLLEHRKYNTHDPSVSKRKRLLVKENMAKLTEEIEKRSDQVYRLCDVVEGQKQHEALAKKAGFSPKMMAAQDVNDTLTSIGLDPIDLSGHVGRAAEEPAGLDGMSETSGYESAGLPWDGSSDEESQF